MSTRVLFILLLCPLCVFAASSREALIEQRIKTIGDVHIQGESAVASAAPTQAGGNSAETIYNTYCKTCHAMGLAGAPKFGVKADWAPRLKQSTDTLHEHAIKGFKGMPPKGTCMTCTDDEIKATVDYMISKVK